MSFKLDRPFAGNKKALNVECLLYLRGHLDLQSCLQSSHKLMNIALSPG